MENEHHFDAIYQDNSGFSMATCWFNGGNVYTGGVQILSQFYRSMIFLAKPWNRPLDAKSQPFLELS